MALGRAFSVAVLGLDGEIVEIEADITRQARGDIGFDLDDLAVQSQYGDREGTPQRH